MVGLDNSNSVQGTSVSSLTTSAWAIAGSERLLVAGFGWSADPPPTYTAIKWGGSGGVSLTQIGSTLAAGSFFRMALAYLPDPVAASQTLYGQVSGVATELCLGGASYTGADPATPIGTAMTNTGSGTGTTFSSTVDVPSAVDELVIDMSYAGSTFGATSTVTVVPGGGQTMLWEQQSIGAFACGTQSTEPGAATVTMSEAFTFNVSDDFAWGIIAVPIIGGITEAPVDVGPQRSSRMAVQQRTA